MSKYFNFAIVASFVGLWLDSFLSNEQQIYIGFLLILSFGILHGANDLALIKDVKHQKNSATLYKVLLYYIIVVLSGAILFYLIPWLALSLFVLVSGYHFSEQQWNEKLQQENFVFTFVYQILYGLIILFLLFTFHADEVQKIIFAITTKVIPIIYFPYLLKIIVTLFIMVSLYFYLKIITFKNFIFKELFFLIVFTIIFKVSSLIWGFALYFILWHSIPSIMDQLKFLFGKADIVNFKLYFKSAFAFWIISLIGIAVLYFLFKDQKIFNALFFSFLASITFPHVLVIQKMFEKERM